MLPMLIDAIRVAGRRFSEARVRESDRGNLSRWDVLRGYRDALSIVCKVVLVAVTINAFSVRAETTEIVASGLWNMETIDVFCNIKDLGTFDLTYANGVYSGTLNFGSEHESPNCQNDEGPDSCTSTGFFASAQDLLTASQFKAMFSAFGESCGDVDSIPSLSFLSPDSISLTQMFPPDESIFSVNMTRAGSTPTSYALGVANAGTGYGSVSSSPAGISCYTPIPGYNYLVAPDCAENFPGGTSVALTATPESGGTFAGWSGACTGTGTCTVTMDAAKSVTATFNAAPFVVATTKIITATSATITTRITFNPSDVGKSGAVYVTAWVPVGALSTLGISATANGQMSVTSTRDNPALAGAANTLRLDQGPLAERDASAFVLVQLTSSGWQLVTNGQLIPYASGVLGDQLAAQTILNNTSTAYLSGAQFCLGYGTSASDMIATGKVQLIATIPDPNLASAATGSCLLTAMPVFRFFNNNAGGHFYTIDAPEKDTVIQHYNWFRNEGTGFNASPVAQTGLLPVYRFFNNNAGGHFYTINAAEKDTVIANYGWFRYEGTGFYASPDQQAGMLPVYRFFNNNAGGHFYTINEAEKDTVIQNYNWFRYEGIGFYAYPPQ